MDFAGKNISKIYDDITSGGYFVVMPGQEIGNKRMLEHIPTNNIHNNGIEKNENYENSITTTTNTNRTFLPFTYSVSFHKS